MQTNFCFRSIFRCLNEIFAKEIKRKIGQYNDGNADSHDGNMQSFGRSSVNYISMFIILKPDYFLLSSKVHFYCRKTQIGVIRINTFKPT